MKKMLAVLLCMVTIGGTLSGCGAKEETVETQVKESVSQEEVQESAGGEEQELEHMDISIGYWDVETALGSRDSDKILQQIEEKFNVTFEPMNYTWDDYGTKLQLWASTDSLPDIFAADVRNSSLFYEWVNSGVIRSLPEDLSAYPNLMEYLDTPALESCKVNGDTYCVYRKSYKEQHQALNCRWIFYRWDLAQAAGIEKEPENWQEFRDMIQAIIAADPENKNIAGMIATDSGLLNEVFLCYTEPRAILNGNMFNWIDNGDGTYVPAYLSGENLGDNVLPTMHLLRDMYTEGTIDHDISLATQDLGKNKFINGQSAAVLTTAQAPDFNELWKSIYGTEMNESVKALDLMPAADGNTYYWAVDMAWSETLFGSAVDDAKMERILQILDYLYTEEGALLSVGGIEGETYTVEDGVITVNLEAMEAYPSRNMFQSLLAWAPNQLPDGYTMASNDPEWYTNEWCKDYFAQAEKIVLPESKQECKLAAMSLDTGFSLHIGNDLLTIMTGDRPVEEMWQEIIEDYKLDGLEECIAGVNEIVD